MSQHHILVVAENPHNLQQIQCNDPQIHSETLLSLDCTREQAGRLLLRVLVPQVWSLFHVEYINQNQHNFYSDRTRDRSFPHNLDRRRLNPESRCICNH